jgi:hypothetical protein
VTEHAGAGAEEVVSRRPRLARLVPLVLFALMTVVHTWPLASDPAHLIYDNADVELNAWIVSWVAHQAPRNPAQLFDGNIFYPDRNVLAFSEPLILPGIVAIAPRLLGASAVLTHNILLMVGFLLTALAGCWVGERLSGDRVGGLFAGSVIAFGPHTLGRLAHLQAHWLFTLPLSLVALDAVIRERSWRAAVGLGICVALLAATSGYGLTIAVVALAAGCVARVGEWWRDWRGLGGRLLLAALLSVLLAFPVVMRYWRVMEVHALTRDALVVSSGAARLTSFLSTTSRLHGDLWSHHFGGWGGTYFPGVAALALAGLSLVCARGWKDPRLHMLVAVVVAGGVVALGPSLPLPFYSLLQHAFPPMRSLREPNRFGSLVVLGVGLLAATGVAVLRRCVAGRSREALSVLVIVAAHVEVFCAPFEFKAFEGFSPVYARLAQEPHRSSLAEFPFYSGGADYLNAGYVLASTAHWTPLVNGYSGFATQAYEQRAEILKHFPDPEALAELRRLGVSHVIVHLDRYSSKPGRLRRVRDLFQRWDRDKMERLAVGPSGEALYRFASAQP